MTRERLTITLKKELLKALDDIVDGEKIRNRSHAIEYLLSKTLVSKAARVLILAGGKGVNFRPLTYELPKAMIPVKGKPLLEHIIQKLKANNLNDVTISVGHLGNKIKEYFKDGSHFGMRINYLDQKSKHSGTAPPLKQAESHFSSGTFLLIYGDVLTDLNFLDLLEFHFSQKGAVATMALTSVEKVSMWGLAKLAGNKVIAFEEKPKSPKTFSHLVNAGVYAMEPSIFKFISKTDTKLESDVFPRIAEEGRLSGYPFEGSWYDVSTPEIYEKVIKEWDGGK